MTLVELPPRPPVARGPLPERSRAPIPAANATVVERATAGDSILELAIQPDGGTVPFEPGQYLSIGLERAGRFVQRPYSIASVPGEPFRFAIRLVPEGALTPALWRLGPGDRVRIGAPRGLFRLLSDDPRPHLLIGTGTGIAPLVAMAGELDRRTRRAGLDDRTTAASAEAAPAAGASTAAAGEPAARPTMVVVQGARTALELVFAQRLRRWAAGPGRRIYVPAVSRPASRANAGWHGAVGRLDAVVPAVVRDLGVSLDDCVAYVCGGQAAVDSIGGALIRGGLPEAALMTEVYRT